MTAPHEQTRVFSVDDANRMLPLVKRIAADIVSLAEQLDERQCRLEALETGAEGTPDPLDLEEWERLQQDIDTDEDRLEEYAAELSELGLELQDAGIGEVDFRTQIEGRDAYLCWRLGEDEVAHWHAEDAGFEDRQSLFLGAASSGGLSPGGSANS